MSCEKEGSMYQKFKTGILVRNKMVEKMEAEGIRVNHKKLNQEEYVTALRNKIVEEAKEVAEEFDRTKLVYELADLLEVFQTFIREEEITESEIFRAQKEKRNKSGGFANRIFTNFVEIDSENPVIEYYLQRPNKYPKI